MVPNTRALTRIAHLTGRPIEYFLAGRIPDERAPEFFDTRRYAVEVARAVALISRAAEASAADGPAWTGLLQLLQMHITAEEYKARTRVGGGTS